MLVGLMPSVQTTRDDMRPMRLRGTAVPWLVGLGVLLMGGAASWWGAGHHKTAAAAGTPTEETPSGGAVAVEVTSPRPGGIDRVCRQPGSCEPMEFADLYSKVSGFLAEQSADIGDPVKAGQVLA